MALLICNQCSLSDTVAEDDRRANLDSPSLLANTHGVHYPTRPVSFQESIKLRRMILQFSFILNACCRVIYFYLFLNSMKFVFKQMLLLLMLNSLLSHHCCCPAFICAVCQAGGSISSRWSRNRFDSLLYELVFLHCMSVQEWSCILVQSSHKLLDRHKAFTPGRYIVL